jgi:hypothetical protein
MSTARDFDFFHGSWSVAHRRLKERLANCDEWLTLHGTAECRPVLRGLGNTDSCTLDGSDWEGMTLRLFDQRTKLWSIHWADTSGARLDPPLTGSFENGTGIFFGDDQHDGRPVRIRFIWRDLGPDRATWEQAFSEDGERTWETNWTMEFTRCRAGLPDPAPPSTPR